MTYQKQHPVSNKKHVEIKKIHKEKREIRVWVLLSSQLKPLICTAQLEKDSTHLNFMSLQEAQAKSLSAAVITDGQTDREGEGVMHRDEM